MFRKKSEKEHILSLSFENKDNALKFLELMKKYFSPEIMTGSNIFKMVDGIFIAVFMFSEKVDFKGLRKEAKFMGGRKFKIKGDFMGLKDYAVWGVIGDAGVLIQ